MNRHLHIVVLAALFALLGIFSQMRPALSHSRSAGKLVVPIGYEPYDSIRFSHYGLGALSIPERTK